MIALRIYFALMFLIGCFMVFKNIDMFVKLQIWLWRRLTVKRKPKKQ